METDRRVVENVQAAAGYVWEIMPLTEGRARIIWTDGLTVDRGF